MGKLEIITPEWSEVLERIKGLGSVYEITEHGSAWPVKRHNAKPEHYLLPDYMSFGDYSGSSVDRANVQVFMETFGECEGVNVRHEGHGSEMVMIRLDCLTGEMLEALEGLQDYPCLDDEAVSRLEMDMEDEDWENWIGWDLRVDLENKFDSDEELDEGEKEEIQSLIINATDDALFTLYRELCQRTGEYWHSEAATSGYVNVEKLVKACTIADIEGLKGE